MVGRKRRTRRPVAGSHQRCWLWGRHAVLEVLEAGRWIPLELRLSEQLEAAVREQVVAAAEGVGTPVALHPAEKLTAWCGSNEHQGLLAQMPPYPWLDVETVLAAAPGTPLYLILDRIQDPHNFGAILRSAEVFGVDAVFAGETQQCDVTPHVARSSAGAVNYLRLARTADLSSLVDQLNSRGVTTLAAAAGGTAAQEQDLTRPAALIVGNEGEGVSEQLLQAARGTIAIPQIGRLDSLNAAVAAGILLYEAQRQRESHVG